MCEEYCIFLHHLDVDEWKDEYGLDDVVSIDLSMHHFVLFGDQTHLIFELSTRNIFIFGALTQIIFHKFFQIRRFARKCESAFTEIDLCCDWKESLTDDGCTEWQGIYLYSHLHIEQWTHLIDLLSCNMTRMCDMYIDDVFDRSMRRKKKSIIVDQSVADARGVRSSSTKIEQRKKNAMHTVQYAALWHYLPNNLTVRTESRVNTERDVFPQSCLLEWCGLPTLK